MNIAATPSSSLWFGTHIKSEGCSLQPVIISHDHPTTHSVGICPVGATTLKDCYLAMVGRDQTDQTQMHQKLAKRSPAF